jgi:DNA-binding response OmpR family regulator
VSIILVVDDEPDILDLLSTILADEGYVTVTAHDGEAALEVLAGAAVDLVITDTMMPRLGGVELIRSMRSRSSLKKTPTVIMSAAVRPSLDGLGTCVFMSKPFDLGELLDTVERAVRERRC